MLEVDIARKRIGLSMRLDDEPGAPRAARERGNDVRPARDAQREKPAPVGGTFADAFAKARRT